MNPFIPPTLPSFNPPPLFPDVHIDPSKLFQPDMNECALKLALLTLNLSRAEYNSMSLEEMKRFQTGDEKEMLALDILICSKNRNKRQPRIFHQTMI